MLLIGIFLLTVPVLGPLLVANVVTTELNLTSDWSYAIILLGSFFIQLFIYHLTGAI